MFEILSYYLPQINIINEFNVLQNIKHVKIPSQIVHMITTHSLHSGKVKILFESLFFFFQYAHWLCEQPTTLLARILLCCWHVLGSFAWVIPLWAVRVQNLHHCYAHTIMHHIYCLQESECLFFRLISLEIGLLQSFVYILIYNGKIVNILTSEMLSRIE